MYIENSIKRYLDDLAARLPAPGGGSASALGAAIGVSLMMMAANYTAGNPRYKEHEKKVSDILAKSKALKERLEGLIDADVEAYGKLSKELKTTKDPRTLDNAYRQALGVPFEICKIAAKSLELCSSLVDIQNKNLITDTAIAAIMLEGAFFSAKYNVYINLKFIKDMDFIGQVHNVLSPLEESMPKLKEEILEKCEDALAK